ncbi:MAG: hypothetical protein J6R85_00675 [Lentisphaeria bacterium]|nr:hypothetical protein [Lentisphaeria bacterium]
MKKMMTMALVAVFAAVLFSGCTTVQEAKRFNGMPLDNGAAPVAHTYVKIGGYYFLGFLPIVSGSVGDTGKIAFFKDTVTVDHAVRVLTRYSRGAGATEIRNINSTTGFWPILPLLLHYCYVEANGTGVNK